MDKLRILSYTDEGYTQKHKEKISLLINPESLKQEKGIIYNEDSQLGTTNSTKVFKGYGSEKLSFDFLIDCTGVIEGTKREDRVATKVNELESSLYAYNSEAHRPSFIVIAYGELLFKGQLTSMNVNYTLFSSSGIALRAKVSLAFSGYLGSNEDKKKFSKLSPDMSRLIVLKESDTLAALCNKIYGNSLLVGAVARFNNLNGFRSIPAGTEVLFPALKKS